VAYPPVSPSLPTKTPFSAGERRAIINKEKETQVPDCDLQAIIPAITGKIELI